MTKFKEGDYTMRNGDPAKVCMVREDGKILGAAIIGGEWEAESWEPDGRWGSEAPFQLDLMPPRREWWVSTCPAGITIATATKDGAEWHANGTGKIVHVREVRDE